MTLSSINRRDGFSFATKITNRLTYRKVIPGSNAIRIIPTSIPRMEKRILCATFLEAVLRFYEDPVNMAAFERWRMGKGGQRDGQKDG